MTPSLDPARDLLAAEALQLAHAIGDARRVEYDHPGMRAQRDRQLERSMSRLKSLLFAVDLLSHLEPAVPFALYGYPN